MLKTIKSKIINWLFKEHKANLDAQAEVLRIALQRKIDTVSVVDLMYERMKAYNPLNITNPEYDILVYKIKSDEDEAFLAQAHELFKNPVFSELIEWLTRVQINSSAKEAEDLIDLNFGRAHISAYELFRDEVARLNKAYVERHAPKEEFDKHAVI